LNTDETHHKLSTASDKGGPTTNSYACASFPRSGERITESSRHTTGVYAVNLAGEVLPPLYIYDSKAKKEENFAVDPEIVERLPKVAGRYGLLKKTEFGSFVSVRRKGSMDTSLWAKFNEEVILPCYPNVAKKVTRCPITHKILSGPLIVKTDAGPGRLAKEAESWEFRERMNEKGVVILLGLPNGTSVNQEMDQGYADLKTECKKSTKRVAVRRWRSGSTHARRLRRRASPQR